MIRHGSLLALLMVVFVSFEAHAQWVFSPAFYYASTTTKPSSGASSTSTATYIHARVGYRLTDLIYVGGIYATEKTNCGGTPCDERTGYGPSIGLMSENLYGILHYYVNVEDGSPSGSKRVEGTGPQIDLGYYFKMNDTFGLAPQLTWRSITWKKIKAVGGAETEDKHTESNIFPMIALFVMF